MTKPGPRPAPPALKLLRGNPGKRKVEPGLQLPPVEPVEPDWAPLLGVEAAPWAAEAWAEVVPMLVAHGVVSGVDLPLVVDYCVTRVRLRQCEAQVSRDGLVVSGAMGGMVRNPALTAAIQLRRLVLSYCGELGLGPSSRGSMPTAAPRDSSGLLD